MAQDASRQLDISTGNDFYRRYAHYFILGMIALLLLMIAVVGLVTYQLEHRPLPAFFAQQEDGQKMELTAFYEPNLLPQTILTWASKAAIMAYTFKFQAESYNEALKLVHPYFTPKGWREYLGPVVSLIDTIEKNQLFVYSVVAGTPVIVNQGPLPQIDYAWRVQIPFLVTYVSANTVYNRKFYVQLMIVRVPTSENPQGIGIEQF